MLQPFAQANSLQRLLSALHALFFIHTGIYQRQSYILLRCQLSQQIKVLEDKAYLCITCMRQLIVIIAGNLLAIKKIFAGGRSVQTAENIHHC